MKQLQFLLAVGLFVIGAVGAHAAPTILIGGSTNNGNLDRTYAEVIVDNAPPGAGAEDLFLPKPQVWENVGTRIISGPYEDEMSSEPWAGPAPTPVTTDGNLNPPHPEGCGGADCGVYFKPFSGGVVNGLATGHLQQTHPAIGGWAYTLTGWAGAEANALMQDAQFAIEFFDDGGFISGEVLTLRPTLFLNNGQPFNYKQYSVSAVAPGIAVSVRVRASMINAQFNPMGGGQAFVVDDFTLTAVPEPTTAMMLAIGAIGLLGVARRR
jgi:hypothetical protein